MRKGVADMYRRSEVSQSSNDRYAEALPAVETDRTIGEWATELSRGVTKGGKRYRGIRLFSEEDVKLLEAIGSGDWVVEGFRNGDIAERLYGPATDKKERARRSSRLSYRFRLLGAHGLIDS